MAGTHQDFIKILKYEPEKSVPRTEQQILESLAEREQKQYKQWLLERKKQGKDSSIYEFMLEKGKKRFSEYKKQRVENKYDNWILQRKEQGKDYSKNLFDKLQAYLQREEQKMEELLQGLYKIAEKKYNRGYKYTANDDLMSDAKKMLYEWRESDSEYKELKEDIEELRYISDNPVQTLVADGR